MAPDRLALYKTVARSLAITSAIFTISPRIPQPFKWFLVFLLALNARGFPLAWHFRVLWPWYKAIMIDRLVNYRGGASGRVKRLTKLSPIGKNPLEPVTVFQTRAGVADCDYNGHLSNSAFAKNVDYVRVKALVHAFPMFCGHLALAGAYYQFVKEIPMFAEYEIRVSIGGWEADKWFYLVAQFVTYPDHGKSEPKSKSNPVKVDAEGGGLKEALKDIVSLESSIESQSNFLIPPSITAPTSGSTTPAAQSTSSASENGIPILPLPAGAVLHATAVSVYCFKVGRITVPPRVAMISIGFGNTARWDQIQAWHKDGTLKERVRNGWKEDTTGFWGFEEHEAEGRRRGERLKEMRGTLDSMSGR